ncbi:MAG: hypothetical protein IT181_11820 [Acidobacteria bacterium]|nr:hypothetical protein [Acidobacteriota bacterium]
MSLLQDLAALATAVGVLVAVWQLWESRKVAKTQFEDTLNAQYRALLAELPLEALLGKELSPVALAESLRVFYRYFDLSNEQAFLHEKNRVRPETWANWREGIVQNMARPAFRQAWERLLPDLDGSFDELKVLVRSNTPSQRESAT